MVLWTRYKRNLNLNLYLKTAGSRAGPFSTAENAAVFMTTDAAEERITTRQLAKCQWNSGLACTNKNSLASRVFTLSLSLPLRVKIKT
jgi:hypothetical protein